MVRIAKGSMQGSHRRRAGLAAAAAVLSALLAGTASADMVTVQQDGTPIASLPGVGGRVVARVDGGFPLTVLGRDGEWLKVASPRLRVAGDLWVPAGRVSDVVAAPAEPVAASRADVPQFRITTDATDGTAAISSRGTAEAAQERTDSSAVARASPSDSDRAAIGAVEPVGNPTPAAGNATPASGNPVAAGGNPTPAVGDTTPASGNPTAAAGNPTPAAGNPTPAMGNPTPAPGNPTPAMGNPVGAFSGPPVGM